MCFAEKLRMRSDPQLAFLLQIEQWQILWCVLEGCSAAIGYRVHPLLTRNGGLPKIVISAVADVAEYDVVALSIVATDGGLVIQRKPVDTHTVGVCCRLFEVHPVSFAAVSLVLQMADARSGQPSVQRAEVVFANHNRHLQHFVNL